MNGQSYRSAIGSSGPATGGLVAAIANRRVQAVNHAQPLAFVPVYARRWHAYRDTERTTPIVGTKGWEIR